MKKFKHILLIAIGLLAGIILLIIGKTELADNSEKIVLNIDGRDYVLFTARTALEKARGLSGIKELKGVDGMIFYFDSPQSPTFWNKNTHLDLELIWMAGGKIVGRDFLPSEDGTGLVAKIAPQKVNRVVELVKIALDKN